MGVLCWYQPQDGLGLSDLLPQDSQKDSSTPAHGAEPPRPSEAEVAGALVKIECDANIAPAPGSPAAQSVAATPQGGLSRTMGVALYLSVGFALITLLAWSIQNAARRIQSWAASSTSNGASGIRRTGTRARSSSQQAEAESLLQRLATGDPAAIDQVLVESGGWIGKTRRTPRTNQLLMAAFNQHDLHARGAALQATLAMDGIAWNEEGLSQVERAVANPSQQAWALWTLGALGNRGVAQERVVQILKGYLDDSNVRTRSGAVDGLGIVASDETVPILLDRFRNDPSPVVQESAARNLGDGGMYTYKQQMSAAGSLVGWMDDAQLTPPQRAWAAHALLDISGQNFGTDAAAWQSWYNTSH